MDAVHYTPDQLIAVAQFTEEDIAHIRLCRRPHNRLGFGYQLAFVRLTNRFPAQQPFEIQEEIVHYVSIQLNILSDTISAYTQRRETIAEHQERIRQYLGLSRFGEAERAQLQTFIFEEACRVEQTSALLHKTEQFLREHGILTPAEDTLRRFIVTQRKEARQHIFSKMTKALSETLMTKLDSLLKTTDTRISALQLLKHPPGRPSPAALLRLTNKLEHIETIGVLQVDLSWLNNNFQRSLARYVRRCDANRLREVKPDHRYAALVCFLWETYRNTVDVMVDMYDKLINKIYNNAQKDLDAYTRSQRKQLRKSLTTFQTLANVLLDDAVDDPTVRATVFQKIPKDDLLTQLEDVNTWLTGKHSHVFHLVVQRFSYIRQFSPDLLKYLQLQSENGANASLLKAIQLLQEMNVQHKRKLPDDAPTGFLSKTMQSLITSDGKVQKAAWECAVLTTIRDEIKSGNLSVKKSTRFGQFDDFFIPKPQWETLRESFFQRAGLPSDPQEAVAYLTQRLNQAYDRFLEQLPQNTYVTVDENGWSLSVDPVETLNSDEEHCLEHLKTWLAAQMRTIKLPELLIEVDNHLKFTQYFLSVSQQEHPQVEGICAILATIIAHGCNIGPYTMAQLTEGVSYKQIKQISDWMLTEEALCSALALVVNAMSSLDITQEWGDGTTSSSDGQRFTLRRKVLQQTYSPKFSDFALEFYTFVADNYAPFYSLPIECTDRDAPYVLDGLLYNESDLPLEEHYTDTHGYTEINFAAFAMYGRRFAPRIKAMTKQRIYRIDTNKDYQSLSELVNRNDRTLNMDWVSEQWDRVGHFFASLECGHVTASTALKRLNGYSSKNHFYRAVRETGRIFKTEHMLQYMSDRNLRKRTRQGLLKGEQIHGLARDVKYGKQGRISHRELHEQRMSCSCLTLLLACIIYWQAKEIHRVVTECDPEGSGVDVSLIEHISPVSWDNVILYGEYVLNQKLIKL